jgi:transposase
MRRRVFARAFKLAAVERVLAGEPVGEVAQERALSVRVLRRWVAQARGDPQEIFAGRGRRIPREAEVARLKRELARAQAQCAILKKTLAAA